VRNDQNQIVLWSNNGSESLYLYTIPVLPIDPQSSFGGAAYAQWYASNGAIGIKPTDPELLKGFALLRSAVSQPAERRVEIAQDIWKLLVDQVWSIGIVGQSPAYMGTRVVNERLENVPARTCVCNIAAPRGAAIRNSGITDRRPSRSHYLAHACFLVGRSVRPARPAQWPLARHFNNRFSTTDTASAVR